MNLTKNQIYIISAIVIAVIVYFVFFKKKSPKVVMAPAPAPKAESGYFGQQWNWGSGPQEYTAPQQLAMVSANPYNSVAGTMDAGYTSQNNPWPGAVGRGAGETGYVHSMGMPANIAGGGTNWLG